MREQEMGVERAPTMLRVPPIGHARRAWTVRLSGLTVFVYRAGRVAHYPYHNPRHIYDVRRAKALCGRPGALVLCAA